MADSTKGDKIYAFKQQQHQQAQQQSAGGWTKAGRWGIIAVVLVGLWMFIVPDSRLLLPTISTNAPKRDACMYKAHPAELSLDLEGFDWGQASKQGFIGNGYVSERLNMRYYRTVVRLAEQYAPDAQSILDVGAPWPFVTAFTWIANKTMLNDRYPDGYKAPTAVGLMETDFYNFKPQQRYDVVICNQVLEHVPNPAKFAKKLLEVGKVVIVSVPFNWPSGPKGHIHHHIQQEELLDWFGTTTYAEIGVVQEKGRGSTSARRMYVVFDHLQEDPVMETEEEGSVGNRKMMLK